MNGQVRSINGREWDIQKSMDQLYLLPCPVSSDQPLLKVLVHTNTRLDTICTKVPFNSLMPIVIGPITQYFECFTHC